MPRGPESFGNTAVEEEEKEQETILPTEHLDRRLTRIIERDAVEDPARLQKRTAGDFESDRKQTEQEWETRADARDSYRSIWKKMFGKERTSTMDIAIEEAVKMDQDIEKLIAQGEFPNATDAIGYLNRLEELQPKNKEVIGQEEWARAETIRLESALQENKFSKAAGILFHVEDSGKEIDETLKGSLRNTLASLVRNKFVELSQSKDGKQFVRAVQQIGKGTHQEDLGLSEEILKSPEIVAAAKEHLARLVDATFPNEPQTFLEARDRYIEMGILTLEDIQNAPDIQHGVQKRLISQLRGWGKKAFLDLRNEYGRLGIVNRDVADKWLQEDERQTKKT